MVVVISFRSGSAQESRIQSRMIGEINYQFLVSEVLVTGHIVHAGKMGCHFMKKVFELILRDEYKRFTTVEGVDVVP